MWVSECVCVCACVICTGLVYALLLQMCVWLLLCVFRWRSWDAWIIPMCWSSSASSTKTSGSTSSLSTSKEERWETSSRIWCVWTICSRVCLKWWCKARLMFRTVWTVHSTVHTNALMLYCCTRLYEGFSMNIVFWMWMCLICAGQRLSMETESEFCQGHFLWDGESVLPSSGHSAGVTRLLGHATAGSRDCWVTRLRGHATAGSRDCWVTRLLGHRLHFKPF